jgi:hypothetical protein
MYAVNEYTSYEKVLALTRMELGIKGTGEDLLLRTLIEEGLKEIPSLDLVYTPNEPIRLEVCDNVATLPCGFVRISSPNAIRICDENGYYYYPRTINDSVFNCDKTYPAYGSIRMDKQYIYFTPDNKAKYVDILPTLLRTENGKLVFPATHNRVVRAYVKWRYSQSPLNSSKFDLQTRREFNIEWAAGKASLKGRSKQLNNNDKQEIYDIMVGLL